MGGKIRGGILEIYWSAIATGIIFAGGFVLWLIFNWRLFILGVHVHHFPLGILAIFLGFLSLVITSVQASFSAKAQGKRYGVIVNYTTIPMVSAAIYFIIAAILLYTDWADFTTWLSNPAMFNWGV